jgi:DNA-binding GntR family transcriptional regulator
VAPPVRRPDPPYLRVAAAIRDRIASGQLQEGDRVPSAREMTREWSISLATASKVLATLRSEGFVRAVQGVGTVVSAADTMRLGARDRMASIRRRGRIYPPGQYARIVAAEMVSAPAHVADALGVATGAPVIRRHRVTYQRQAQGQEARPVSASTSWFDGALAGACPRLLQAERIQEGTSGHIEAATGRHVTTGRDQLAADQAAAQDVQDLELELGVPVLRGRNWYWDAAGEAIEYGESVSIARRWTAYDYEIGDREA